MKCSHNHRQIKLQNNQEINQRPLWTSWKKTVLHHKIPYWNERETKGDGNCFYNAILDQIQNNPGVYDTLSENAKQCSTPSELRAAVITFIKSWPPALSTQETLNQWKISLDWNTYLDQ